jgi:type I restriction enzyme, S subunit
MVMGFEIESPIGVPDLPGVPEHWAWGTLRSICSGVYDCPHTTPDLAEVGPFVVRSQDIRTGVLRTDLAAVVTEQTYQSRIARAEPTHGDILFSREGTYFGIAAEVPPNTRLCLGQRMVLLRPDRTRINHRFLLFWLNSSIMAVFGRGFHDGSVAQRLNLSTIRDLPVILPSMQEQGSIARILGTLNDKIELNRRMNLTLDQLARALFRSWFIDFDPVVAKAAGKKPVGMSSQTAALFPNRFRDSELGPIPKDWRIVPIGDLVTVVGGSTPSTGDSTFWDGGTIPWATPKDLSDLSDPVLTDTERKITAAGLEQISSGLLPTGTVLMSSRAPVGYLAIADMPVAINQGFIAMKCGAASPNVFVLLWAQANMDEIECRANGTTFMEISKASFRPIPVVVPPEGVMKAFADRALPLFNRIVANVRLSKSLEVMRDTLLPLLMSGELRVGQAQLAVDHTADGLLFPLERAAPTKRSTQKKATTDEFKEAILISALVRGLAKADYPLGRKRYNKFGYMVHRKAEHDVKQKFLKKAAGPYSPWAKYQGPENIAVRNGYVGRAKTEKFAGLVAGPKITEIDRYLPNYGFADALTWAVATFRFEKNDELELLTTVDFAVLDLLERGQAADWQSVKDVIRANKEWAPKLDRTIFSDTNIVRAMKRLQSWFPSTYG